MPQPTSGTCSRAIQFLESGANVALLTPTQDFLNSILLYNAETGVLLWKPRPRSMFDTFRAFRTWNARYAEKPAGQINDQGYVRITLRPYGQFRSHRLIWKMVYGEEAEYCDHINGTRNDNRLTNLRSVDMTTNNRNVRHREVASGHKGITLHQGGLRVRTCGYDANFKDDLELALLFRDEVWAKNGYGPNHGVISCQ